MQSHVKGCLTESPGRLQQESTCRGVRRGELQLPNRGAVKDDRDDRDGVCHPQLGGCTPQLPAKGSHASTRHSAQPQTGSKTQALRAWWVLFKQKYRGVQISQEEMLGENTFTTLPPHSLLLPRVSQKAGWLLQCLQSLCGNIHLLTHLDKRITSSSFLLEKFVFQFSLTY